eukprot:TRINITY_DN4339_c0_g1_i2.p1 TRINITY_DN4339_c0_g1~~TRINITY_DN4339_c0_g1_i2.p1  ORF type:complete len:205 (+),score=18.80 TRINITY_DN4339_c0_g1_i2:38-652(+)
MSGPTIASPGHVPSARRPTLGLLLQSADPSLPVRCSACTRPAGPSAQVCGQCGGVLVCTSVGIHVRLVNDLLIFPMLDHAAEQLGVAHQYKAFQSTAPLGTTGVVIAEGPVECHLLVAVRTDSADQRVVICSVDGLELATDLLSPAPAGGSISSAAGGSITPSAGQPRSPAMSPSATLTAVPPAAGVGGSSMPLPLPRPVPEEV